LCSAVSPVVCIDISDRLEGLVTSSVVYDGVVQGTMDIGVSVHESLPMPWARVCLESHERVDSVRQVRACCNLGPHKASERGTIRLVDHEQPVI